MKIIKLLLSTFVLFFVTKAQASLVTITFDSFTKQGIYKDPYQESGYSFTPNCHYDALTPGYHGHMSSAIGFDLSGCLDDNLPAATLRVKNLTGLKFDLIYFYAVTRVFQITTSKGGFLDIGSYVVSSHSGDDRNIYFSGEQWSNLDWFELSTNSGAPEGFDNVKLKTVNESTTLMSFLFFPLILLFRRNFPRKN